jgi:hypothetical protein
MTENSWLKALGSAANPLPEDWQSMQVLTEAVMFARRPMVRMGDKIVYYASGTGVFFARGTVTSQPYLRKHIPTDLENWPWYVDVRLEAQVDHLRFGVPLKNLSVDGREVTVSMRRRSHIRLTEAEYGAAVDALPAGPME